MSDPIQSLQDFYNEMANKGLRLQHQFQVTFQPPANAHKHITDYVTDINKLFGKDIVYYATTTNLPGKTQNLHERKFMGYPFQIPTTMDYDKTTSMEMLCDSGLDSQGDDYNSSGQIRKALLAWMNYHSSIGIEKGLEGHNAGGAKRIPIDSTVTVGLLDEGLTKPVERYILHGAFPNQVGDMALSHDSGDPATFNLTVSYQYFTIEKVGQAQG